MHEKCKEVVVMWALLAKTKGYDYTTDIMKKFVESVPAAITSAGAAALLA